MTPARKKPDESELSALELAVMDVIWELGECNSREVIDAYNHKTGRNLADTTVRTIIANLRRKNYVLPVPTIERGMRLKPAVGREPVARRNFRELIARFFGGSPSRALAYLVENEPISAAELEALRKLLDARKQGSKDR